MEFTLLALIAVAVWFFKRPIADVSSIAENASSYGVARTSHLPEFGRLEAELDLIEKKHELEQRRKAIEAMTKPVEL